MEMNTGGMRPGSLALVTGATGFTGSVLVRQLASQGVRVRAVARASSVRESLGGIPVEWVVGDVFDPQTVSAAAAGVDYVFHLAAAYRQSGLSDEAYRRVHVLSTRLLAEAVLANPGFKRFVHISTVGVHGHIEHPPADETAPFAPGDIYQQTKAEAETWLHAFAQSRGLPYTVIRPAAIYGPGDRRLLKVFKMALWPVFPLLGYGHHLYHLVHVEDLAQGMILAAVHPAAVGEVFICGNPEAVTLEELGRIVAESFGRKCRPVRIPAWPFFLAAYLCEAVCRPLGIAPPIYRRRVAFFTKDRSFDTRKMHQKLGYQTRYSTRDGLAQTARWYREQGWL
jgi:dihydroflavonol-4-reductase